MRNETTTILSNKQIAPVSYRMSIDSPYLAKTARPGQFVEVLCSPQTDPLLRRPFGVHRITPRGIEILYEAVGKGTTLMTQMRPGQTLDILGPLGNGFTISRPTRQAASRQTMIIAGGIGVAPLLALAEVMADGKNTHIIIGARKKSRILCANDFKKLGLKVTITTDDGSKGRKGLVTDVLKDLLRATKSQDESLARPFARHCGEDAERRCSDEAIYQFYACGPTPMLKAIWQIAGPRNIPCQFSFESRMACGIGVCLGCPIKVRSTTSHATHNAQHEYKMVCKDGPVFSGGEVVWE